VSSHGPAEAGPRYACVMVSAVSPAENFERYFSCIFSTQKTPTLCPFLSLFRFLSFFVVKSVCWASVGRGRNIINVHNVMGLCQSSTHTHTHRASRLGVGTSRGGLRTPALSTIKFCLPIRKHRVSNHDDDDDNGVGGDDGVGVRVLTMMIMMTMICSRLQH